MVIPLCSAPATAAAPAAVSPTGEPGAKDASALAGENQMDGYMDLYPLFYSNNFVARRLGFLDAAPASGEMAHGCSPPPTRRQDPGATPYGSTL